MDDITALSYYCIVDGPSLDTIVARLECRPLEKEPYFVCQAADVVGVGPSLAPMVVARPNAPKLKFDLVAVKSIGRPNPSSRDEVHIVCLTGFDWKIWRTLKLLPARRDGHFILPEDSDPHFRLESSSSR